MHEKVIRTFGEIEMGALNGMISLIKIKI